MKPERQYSDQELIEGIINNDSLVIEFIYAENFHSIRHYVLLNNGSEDDAKDVFQESLILLYKKAKSSDLVLSSSLGTFLYSICRFLWLKELSNKKKKSIVENVEPDIISDEKGIIEILERNERLSLYREKYEELSDDCKRILKMFLNNIPIKEITQAMGYHSDQHTKNRRFRCKKSLIVKIQECRKFKELGNGKIETN